MKINKKVLRKTGNGRNICAYYIETEYAGDSMNEFISGCDGLIHVIQKGDTLYRLSRKYHVSVAVIMYKNPYANIYNLQVGDELCIPVGRPETAGRAENDEDFIKTFGLR